ncbi:MAG: hypothetical protein ACLFSM_08920 [Thermoplasmata archaeon]
MKRMDKWMLIGCFLLIAGAFLPWYSVQFSSQSLPWQTREFSSTVFGFTTYAGLALLVLASINTLVTLIPKDEYEGRRLKVGQLFLSGLIVFPFLFIVMQPIFISPYNSYFDPEWGLVFILIGSLIVGIAAIGKYRE